MKKYTMMFVLASMTAGLTVNATEAKKTQAAPVVAVEETKISSDEVSFSSKLNDQNRKAFSENLSTEQKNAVMVAGKNGANPDEAVQRMIASKDLKDAPVISSAETEAPAAH